MLEIIIEFPVKTKVREPLSETERVTTQFLTRLRGIHLRLHLLLIQRFCIRWIMQQASLWCRTNGLSLFNFHFERGSLDDAVSRSCCQSGLYNLVFHAQSWFSRDSLRFYTDVTVRYYLVVLIGNTPHYVNTSGTSGSHCFHTGYVKTEIALRATNALSENLCFAVCLVMGWYSFIKYLKKYFRNALYFVLNA